MEVNENIQKLIEIFNANGKPEQANDLSQLIQYMSVMQKQLDTVLQELKSVQKQLDAQKTPKENVLSAALSEAERKILQVQTQLHSLMDKIADSAKSALQSFKEVGIAALDKASNALNSTVTTTLESVQHGLDSAVQSVQRAEVRYEHVGAEIRQASQHLKNAARAAVGKEADRSDVTPEGLQQKIILAPVRLTKKLLIEMRDMTAATVEKMGSKIEREPETVQMEQPRKFAPQKKPSILQSLRKERSSIASRTAPQREREAKEVLR